MTTLAELGVRVDSQGVDSTADDLDRLASSGAKAEQAAGRFGDAWDEARARLGITSRDVKKAIAEQHNELGKLLGQIDPTVAALGRLDDQQRKLAQFKANGILDADTFKEYDAKIEATRQGLGRFDGDLNKTGMTAKQTAAAMRGLPAQFTDIFTSLAAGQSPMMVFLQQGGQIKDMFGGIGPAAQAMGSYVLGLVNPYTLAAAAVGTLTLAYYQGSGEADAYRMALESTGNAAGTTTTEMAGMADAVSNTVGTTSKAAEVLAQLAGTGKVAAGSFVEIAKAAIEWEKAGGQAASVTVAEFAKLADDPVKAVVELNEKYNFLTLAVFEQINALQEQGDKQGAADLAERAYAQALTERAEQIKQNLGTVESAWKTTTEAAAKAWDAMLGIGREKSPSEVLQDFYDRQSANQANFAASAAAGLGPIGTGISALIIGLDNFGEEQKSVEAMWLDIAKAGEDALDAQHNGQRLAEEKERIAAAKSWSEDRKQYLTDEKKLEDEIARIRERGAKAGAEQAEIEARIAKIRADAAGKTGRGGKSELQRQAEEEEKALQRLIAQYAPLSTAEKKREAELVRLDAAWASGAMSADQYQEAIENVWKTQNKDGWDTLNKQAAKDAAALKSLAADAQRIVDRYDPIGAAARRLAKEQETLNKALDAGELSWEKYQTGMKGAQREYDDVANKAGQWAQLTEEAFERVSERGADMWEEFFDTGKVSFDSLLDVAKRWAAEMANAVTIKPLLTDMSNWVLNTNNPGGLSDVWGGFFGGGSGGTGSGGGGGSGGSLQQGMQTASTLKNAYSLYTSGFAGMTSTLGGYVASLGNMLGMSSIGNFGIGMQGATLAPGLAGPTTMGASGTMGLGAKFGSTMSGLASNPITWIVAALLGSYQFGQAGYRLDEKQIRDTELAKYSTAIDPLGSVFLDALITKPVLFGQKTLSPIFGEKWGSILSGGALVSGLHNTLNKALFGGEWKTKDFGIGLGIDGGELDAQQFEYRKKKGGLFSSGKKKTIWKDLDPETQAALDETYELTENNVSALFKELGIAVEDGSLSGLKLARTQISTKGKTEEEIQTAVADWFGTAASAMTAELNRVFDTGLEVDFAGMQAFVGNLVSVNDLLKTIGKDEFEASVAGGRMAEHLSEVAGGFDVLSASVGTYYAAFFTEQERFDAALKATTEQFTEAYKTAGIEAPDSAAAFRAMISDIDTTTEAGREMFATMVALAGQTDAYFKAVAQNAANTAATQMNSANNAFSLVQRSISAEQQRLTAEYQAKVAAADAQAQAYAQAAAAAAAGRANNLQALVTKSSDRIRSINSVISALDKALESLRDTSDETTKQLRAQAVATIQQALAGVKAGKSIADFLGLDEALERAADIDTGNYSSLEDFKREQGRTANLVAELRGLAGGQLTAEEKMLASLDAQLSIARSSASASGGYYSVSRTALDREYQLAMEALQKEMDEAQRQMDALNGIDNSVMSVVDAVNAMNVAITTAMKTIGLGSNPAAPAESTSAMVDRMYKAIAGFAPDAGGIHYWTDQLTTGKSSYADFVKALQDARVPAFAAGGMHTGGLRLVGENGPELEVTGPSRIYSASQTKALLSGGTAEEIRGLRDDFAGVKDALRAIAKHTRQTAQRVEMLERWDGDGMPEERTA